MPNRQKLWSVPRITHPNHPGWTLRVTELQPGGSLYAVRMKGGKQKMQSLRCTRVDLGTKRHEQERVARAKAFAIIEELATGKDPAPTTTESGDVLTLKALADAYEKRGLCGRGKSYERDQVAKLRRIEAFLGSERPVVSLCRSDIEAFSAHRRIKDEVRANTIHGDVAALKIALNWATEERRADGRTLLNSNPLQRVRVAKDKTPRRPWATTERYNQLKQVANKLPAAFEALLDLAWSTGRRFGAIHGLRWQDIHLETSKEWPQGAIRWYAGSATTNKRQDQTVPMNSRAREAVDRWREQQPGIGTAWVFPAPKDPTKPLGRWIAKRWLRRAEDLASLPHEAGGGWHAFRRGWATARKDLPLVDVAEAGGWRDTATLIRSYTHADPKTMLKVILA